MKECIFCKIVKRKSPATIVFEDNNVLAIIPLQQISKGHTLLIPKKHFENIFDIDKETLTQLVIPTKQLSIKLVKECNATGINLLNASGKDAQQSVFHFHLHLVPRYPNDGLDLWLKNKL